MPSNMPSCLGALILAMSTLLITFNILIFSRLNLKYHLSTVKPTVYKISDGQKVSVIISSYCRFNGSSWPKLEGLATLPENSVLVRNWKSHLIGHLWHCIHANLDHVAGSVHLGWGICVASYQWICVPLQFENVSFEY